MWMPARHDAAAVVVSQAEEAFNRRVIMVNESGMRGLCIRISALLASFVIAVGLCALPGQAQTGTCTVTGTVRDQRGGVVPGAVVTVTQTSTNLVRKVETSGEGIYYVGNLPWGPYRVEVEKTGFNRWSGTLVLQVGENAVADATLSIGNTKAVVTVNGAAAELQTQNATISNVIGYNQIRDLPLNGRQVSQLFSLTPGVESGGSPRVNGMKVGSTSISLDGISEVDRFGGGFVRVQPGLETVQEFRFDTTDPDARFTTPATVILATRSGTNQFHGTAYEFLRDNSGGLAVRRREDTPGQPLVPLVRNEFGADAGGPLIIPHLYDGRNKTFWFVDYEGLRDNEQALSNVNMVPTAAMWNGDLSNAMNGLGQPDTIYNPATTQPDGSRTAFPNNQIPVSSFGPLAKVLEGLTAQPNNDTNPFLGPNFIKFYPDDTRQSNLMFKVDQNISDKDHLSVRVTRGWATEEQYGGYYAAPASDSSGIGTSTRDTNIYNVGVDFTQSISNRWLNEIQAGVLRSYAHYGTAADFKNWDTILGTPNPFGATGWPTMYACENSGSYFGWDSDNSHVQALTQEVVQDNATFIKGKHTIEFGAKATLEQNNIEELQQEQGSHDFSPGYTTLWSPSDQAPVANTGSGFAELLLDLPTYLSNQYNRGFFYFRQAYTGLYAQDKWQAASRLTVNYGLRWDYWTPYREAENRLDVADTNNALSVFSVLTPGSHSMSSLPGIPPAVLSSWSARGLQYTTANAAGYPSALFRSIYHDFGPRIGVAFKLTDKTVLRGGFGIYYFPMPLSMILQSSRTNPPLNLRFVNNPFQKNADFTYPYVSAPVADDFLPAAAVDINTPQGISKGAIGATIWDGRNWSDSREATWNFTLGQQLWSHTLLRISYVGTHGTDLMQQYSFNDPIAQYNYAVTTGNVPPSNTALLRSNPNWSFLAINHTGYSWDNSAQVQLERRFSNGFDFQWFYTYSRALATADASGFSSGNTTINSVGSFAGGGGATVPAIGNILGEPNLSYSQRQSLAYYNSPSIPPHRITFDGSFMLPVGRGRKFGSNMSRVLDEFIGGWQASTITSWNSGFWMSISPSVFQYGNPRIPAGKRPIMTIFGARQRLWFMGSFDPTQATDVTGGNLQSLIPANIAQQVVRPAGPNCTGQYVGQFAVNLPNGSCYNAPASSLYNWSPRANIIGPGAWDSDISLFKTFAIGERFKARLEGDFFNAFNHPNDVTPDPQTGLQNLGLQANPARIIQLGLRLDW